MHTLRRYRLTMVIFIVTTTSVAVGLMSYALRENINLFYTPSSVISGDAPVNVTIRIGGMVVKDSLTRSKQSLQSTFRVTDGNQRLMFTMTEYFLTCFLKAREQLPQAKSTVI